MADWPATLPAPLAEGYGLEAGDATVRTDMEAGPARVRRRYRSAPDSVSLSWRLSEAQMAVFRAFHDGDIDFGAAWFNLTLRDGRTGGAVSRAVRFVGPYRAGRAGILWTVSAKAEVRLA